MPHYARQQRRHDDDSTITSKRQRPHILMARRRRISLLFMISHFVAAILAFHLGSFYTVETFQKSSGSSSSSSCDCVGSTGNYDLEFAWSSLASSFKNTDTASLSTTITATTSSTTKMQPPKMTHHHSNVFSVDDSIGRRLVITGAVNIPRTDFLSTFDLGIPLEDDDDVGKVPGVSNSMQDVLLLYPSANSLPDPAKNNNNNKDLVYPRQMTAQEATANCQVMKVILTQPSLDAAHKNDTTSDGSSTSSSCLAIMGQQQLDSSFSYHHIQKYVKKKQNRRNNKQKGRQNGIDDNDYEQWQLVPWQYQHDAEKEKPLRLQTPPKPVAIRKAWQTLQSYLSVYQDAVQQLRPIVESIMARQHQLLNNNDNSNDISSRRGGLIVMVCNHGHVELLVNFYCAARAIDMDLSRVLIFATDAQTQKVVQELLGDDLKHQVFYHDGLFSTIPTDAASTYGSLDYAAIMMSKVYVAHLMTLVGDYDFLFHDVDIVPHRPDYLDYLLAHNNTATTSGFDMVFQYDHLGGPVEYQPWYANSGFYLVRHNARTRYFFSVLVRQGDLILRSKSHQTVMTALLSEHVNLYGLRVKVLQKEADLFPGGYHFHHKWDYMRDMMQGKVTTPFIMHMNYNDNKETKRKFNEQIGAWFVHESCMNENGSFLLAVSAREDNNTHGCCVAHPTPKCHYRDKPSKIPCRDFPQVEGGESFW